MFKKCTFFLFAILFLQLGLNYLWLSTDELPLIWDAGLYYTISANHLKEIQEHGLLHFFQNIFLFKQYSPYHPPLLYSLPLPFYSIFGVSRDIAALSTGTLYFFIIIVFTYLIATRLFDERVAILSALFVALSPPLYGMSRSFLMDIPCLAFSLMAIYGFLRSEKFNNHFWSALFVISFALGMWTREFTIIYSAGPLLALYFINPGEDKTIKRNLFLYLCLAFALASIPYSAHLSERINSYVYEQYSKPAIYGNPNNFSLDTMSFYIRTLSRYFSKPASYYIWSLVLLYLILGREKVVKFWLISVYILLTLIGIKTDRFAIGLLPPIAMIISYWLAKNYRFNPLHRLIVVSVLLVQFYICSFDEREMYGAAELLNINKFKSSGITNFFNRLKLAPLQHLTDGSRRPLEDLSKSGEICREIILNGSPKDSIKIYNLTSYPYYTAGLENCLTQYYRKVWATNSIYAPLKDMHKFDYIIDKIGGFQASRWQAEKVKVAKDQFQYTKEQFSPIYQLVLDDSSKVILYKRNNS